MPDRRAQVTGSEPPIRLAVDARVLAGGFDGVSRFLFGLLSEICGHPEVDVVLLARARVNPRYSIDELLARRGVTLHRFESSPTSMRQHLQWPSVIRQVEPDVVFIPYHLAIPPHVRVPKLATVHDCIFETKMAYAPSRRIWATYCLSTFFLLRSVGVVCVSEATREDVERYYRLAIAPGSVIGEGVDAKFRLPVSPREIDEARRVLHLPERYLLHLGARRPHKNAALLVDALNLAPVSDGDCMHLVFAGPGDSRWHDHVPERIAAMNLERRCVDLGVVPERHLRALYAGAEAFLYPSFKEGFGLPLLEAMAVGTPVVASDIPVFREIAGDSVLYADPHDPADWAARVASVLQHPSATARRVAAARKVAADATWALAAQRLLGLVKAAAFVPAGASD